MNYGKSDTLQQLSQINKSLEDMNTFNNSLSLFPYNNNNNYLNDRNISNPIYNYQNPINQNNKISANSALRQIMNINKSIDSVYENVELMKSSNKINSKVLYLIHHSSQTLEDYDD